MKEKSEKREATREGSQTALMLGPVTFSGDYGKRK